MKIGIISAMDSEHRQLADRLSQKRESGEGRFRYVEGILGRNENLSAVIGRTALSAPAWREVSTQACAWAM